LVNENTGFSAVVFVDLSGTFKAISHRLIKKLYRKYDVTLSEIVNDYLSNRKARIISREFQKDRPKLQYLKAAALLGAAK